MISKKQKEKARIFSDMHKANKMFVLPNAWNVGSAYVFEKQGFEAVATSSAGIAYDLGYPDGEDISFNDLLWFVEKISNRVAIPLSVDFERGYGETGAEVKENARKLLLARAVGFNIEDGLPDGKLSSLDLQIEKIKALFELKRELDIDFVINARTCAYWLNVANEEDKLKISQERGNAFMEAGADCVFIPGAIDEATVIKLVQGINGPINIILNGIFNNFESLEKIGVRRLSVGSSPVRYIYSKVIDLANNLRKGNSVDLLNVDFSYGQANSYFEKV
jgi:2-methylisocitrate lyase-like PEP mutase family enzyme